MKHRPSPRGEGMRMRRKPSASERPTVRFRTFSIPRYFHIPCITINWHVAWRLNLTVKPKGNLMFKNYFRLVLCRLVRDKTFAGDPKDTRYKCNKYRHIVV